MTSFKLEASVKANDCIPVKKYRSEKTGLTVIVAQVEGPVVNGYFALTTEAHDDDGLPHTLEHLIFLGSELYPYKGVLDLIANRCLASGTNAWTDTDHTCYTMTTAGSDGFLSLLPIYLDHILYPTLTDAGFITEVHHISGEGEDGGVVYCEMQGRENTGESRVQLEMMRAIYPNSGYSSETGGVMKNLRESTSNEKVRAYHAKFYRPDNLTVIVTGAIEPDDIFKALQTVEDRIVSKGTLPAFERPWMSAIEPLKESINKRILYASDEEDCGIVNVAYRGPFARTEHKILNACSLLMRYLSDTSVSPLQRDLVETSDPHASKISYNIGENSESLLYFSFENVPIEKIDLLFDKYVSVLTAIANGQEKLDMKRLHTVIDKAVLESLSSLESNPHDDIAFHSIGYILYGESEADFEERLNNAREYRELKEKNEEFWINLLKKYFIDAKYVVIRAVPSIDENLKAAKEEAERIERQRNALGAEGLALKEEQLMQAMLANEQPPPNEMLTQIPIPSIKNINFHGLKVYKATTADDCPPGLKLNEMPIYTEAYDLKSNFVYMILSLSTDSVPVELRPYLLILLELFTESPILRDGKLIPYEEVVAELEADTVESGTRIGLEQNSRFSCGPYSNTISIMLQVEPHKYAKGASWMSEIINKTQFTVNRIRVTAAKMVNDVAQAKRNGNATARALIKAIFYKDGTNMKVVQMMKQYKFLSALLEKLEKPDEAQKIIEDLEKVRGIITRGDSVALHVATNWSKLSESGMDLLTPWKTLVKEPQAVVDQLKIIPDYKLMDYNGIASHGVILGMGCVESSFLFQAAPAINNFTDPDLPALMLFLQYLLQLEGPLWRQIRGAGLAYGYSITPRPNEGLLYLSLYRATNVFGAYKETKNIIEAQLQEDAVWDEILLESARSSLIFEVIEREKSVGDVVVQALLYTFKNTSVEYNKNLVQKINSVKKEELARVGQKYVAPLFSSKAKTSIVCHPDKCNDIAAAFEQIGHSLKIETSLEESVLA